MNKVKYFILALALFSAGAFGGLPPTSTKGSGDSNPVTTFEIDAPNIPITHTGVKASLGTIPVAGGGSGQVTANAALNAFLPSQTSNSGKVLQTDGTNTSWQIQPVVASNNQTANYTITTSDSTINFSTGSSSLTATLPTAASVSGRRYTINKTDTGTGSAQLLTTSAQTIGGIASGALYLATANDSITLESDGSNWKIVNFGIEVSFYGTASSQTNASLGATAGWTMSATKDTQLAWSTNAYTCPIAGYYWVSFMANGGPAGSSGLNAAIQSAIFVGGSQFANSSLRNQATGTFNDWWLPIQVLVYCATSTTIGANTQTNFTTAGTGASGILSIARIR